MNTPTKPIQELDHVTVRFAGDSGDGMQLTGTQFTTTAAIIGNDVSTFPDFPAEIRAPAGTIPGVSGFQIQFGSIDIRTPGDRPDVLVAMNPAALKVSLTDLPQGATIIVNKDAFAASDLKKANCATNPLEDGSLAAYRVIELPLKTLTHEALADSGLDTKSKDRCKNFFALGVMFWLYDRPLEPTLEWIQAKFAKLPDIAQANQNALKQGFYYAETAEVFTTHYAVRSATHLPPGQYRQISGNEALALGLATAAAKSGLDGIYCSYPITPASDLLHHLSRYKHLGFKTFQAEDEIAAVCAAIGASFGGQLGITGTSGPGVALKAEAIGLAVMTELPLIVVNVQRAGPSTGMPTKTEQADLLQAMFGRNGECPVGIVAPATPAECFDLAIDAVRLSLTHMVPVFILSDGYLANGAEPWQIPDPDQVPPIPVATVTDPENFQAYGRNPDTLARNWALPGTPGLEHRIGGIEKWDGSGHISYDPDNHHHMCQLRADKIQRMNVPDVEVHGAPQGDLLVVSWGSTFGAMRTAVEQLEQEGLSIGLAHLRHLNPFPSNLGGLLGRYQQVVVPEMNLGQLCMLLRAKFLVDAISFPKVKGRPFQVEELVQRFREIIRGAQ